MPLANFRDVGDGGAVRRGVLFRSDTLQGLDAAEVAELTALGLRFVVDLRAAAEALEGGRPVLGPRACHLNVPFDNVDGHGAPLESVYLHHLRHDDNVRVAIELLAAALPEPTLVHCAAGKDRTGMVIALALGAAGIGHDDIVADYLRSGPNMPSVLRRFRAWPSFRQRSIPEDYYQCQESVIRAFLDCVSGEFGGFDGWARQAGVSTGAITRLRQALNPS
ncbi:tyrosine-protein phosphatase [Amycolatopsis minnesotensis]|uniref:Tyrosine-protein phosphatase n=1 Tax=Amycolatopsis minnesotensis TaxID=337894 RepID=A0ABP5E993_9PSEU